jgi:hypothetical protein
MEEEKAPRHADPKTHLQFFCQCYLLPLVLMIFDDLLATFFPFIVLVLLKEV